MGIPAATVPMMVQGVGIDQNLNAQIPLELKFKDETGQVVRLGQYFREQTGGAGAGVLRVPRPVRPGPERSHPHHGTDFIECGLRL